MNTELCKCGHTFGMEKCCVYTLDCPCYYSEPAEPVAKPLSKCCGAKTESRYEFINNLSHSTYHGVCLKCGKECERVTEPAEPVAKPAISKTENPYHPSEVWNARTVWQEGYEAGKPKVSVEQIAQEIINIKDDCKCEPDYECQSCIQATQIATAILKLIEEGV